MQILQFCEYLIKSGKYMFYQDTQIQHDCIDLMQVSKILGKKLVVIDQKDKY